MNGTPDPTRDALYAAVLAHPDEDTPRLALADLIEEQGDPARAEFIRAQCRFALLNEWDADHTALDVRCRRLLAEHPDWLDPVRQFNDHLLRQAGSLREHHGSGPYSVFVRGFPGVVAADAEWFAQRHADLFDTFPVRRAGFVMETAGARDALVDCPGLDRLTGLGISMWAEEPEGFEALARFRHVSRLQRLEVYSECLNGDPLETLLRSPAFSGLSSFALVSDCGDREPRQPEDVARELDRACWLFGLEELALDGNVFEGLGERLARESNWTPRLKRIRLRGYLGHYGEITDEAVGRIAKGVRSGWLAAVEDLDLVSCDFEGLVLDALSAGPARPARLTLPPRTRSGYQKGLQARNGLLNSSWLSELLVLGAAAGEREVEELLASRLPEQLRVLDLSRGTLTGGRLRALIHAHGGWPNLERLNLARVPLPDGAIKELAALLDRFPRLVSLTAGNGQPAPKFLQRLADSPAAAQFRELILNVPLDDPAADALAQSPHLSDIDLLTVGRGTAGRPALNRLRARFGARLTVNEEVPF
jgi:uncharacterized protein (TIGR02996 family)